MVAAVVAIAAAVAVAVAAAAVVTAAAEVAAAAVIVVVAAIAVAVVAVVAADKAHAEGARNADARASAAPDRAVAEGTQPDAKRPAIFAEGTEPSPKVSAEGTQPEAPAFRVPADLVARATTLGEVWAQEYVRDLRAQARDIIGGWPGTLREARRRVLAAMSRNTEPTHLEELARITNLAARRGWESVSEPDLEP